MYQKIFRPLLFRLAPENVHELTIQLLRVSGAVPPARGLLRLLFDAHSQNGAVSKSKNRISQYQTSQCVDAFGLKFPNPVGLAAGYDKDGLAWSGLTALGFGHIEVGTVTPRPQAGNPKPRVFRIPAERAIINRMGFPGKGADFLARRLATDSRLRSNTILGVNIGKNKDTPNEDAASDYLALLEQFSPLADYLAVNVSSPNTVGLRRLQARDDLESLLHQLAVKRAALPDPKPILVKLAPDLSAAELEDALGAIIGAGMDGVIATNTTIDRAELLSDLGKETGGLSGAPLRTKSLDIVRKIYAQTEGKLPIVGVGGIMCADDAKAMLDAGASLIQVYTGLVYAGPGLVKNIVEAL